MVMPAFKLLLALILLLGDVSPRKKQAEPEKKPNKKVLVGGNRMLFARGCSGCRETIDCVQTGLRYLARHQPSNGIWKKNKPGCSCRPTMPEPKSIKISDLRPAEMKEITGLIARFRNDSIEVRNRAECDLRGFGSKAIPDLVLGMKAEDPETRARCSALVRSIWYPADSSEIQMTGFALLAFLGSGYTHMSKEKVGGIRTGNIMKRGLKALIALQNKSGRIGGKNDISHVIATLALLEAYSHSRSGLLKGPAQRGLHALATIRSWNPRTVAWTTILLRSASLAGLERPPALLEKMEKAIEGKIGAWAEVSRTLLMHLRSKKVNPGRVLALAGGDLSRVSAEQLFVITLLVRNYAPSIWKTWSLKAKNAVGKNRSAVERPCEIGSWKGRVHDTIFATLTMELYYRYAKTLSRKR